MQDQVLSFTNKQSLIQKLLNNEISSAGLERLRLETDEDDLALIIQKIYDLNETQVIKFASQDRLLARADRIKNDQRNEMFFKKIQRGFRKEGHTVILAEGDSWFNYPILLSDVIDWIAMEKNLAVYSLAAGGDWLFNILNMRQYVEELSVINPDIFVISAGGNDLLSSNRLAAIVEPGGRSAGFEKNEWAVKLIDQARERKIIPLDEGRFQEGCRFLSKEFYALLMFFHLQYFFMINGILTAGTGDALKGKFPGIRIITQGYDYAIPSNDKGWGVNPLHWYIPVIRLFFGHGTWLKRPLQLRGIHSPGHQQSIIYSMIYLFNEMMIATGEIFSLNKALKNPVFHIDSRGSTGKKGWTDELHPLPVQFRKTAAAFVDCINGKPSPFGQVYVVKGYIPE